LHPRPGEGERGLDPFGPLIAAIVVIALTEGRGGLAAWSRRLVRWRAAPSLYALALLFPLVATLLGIALNIALGAPVPAAERWQSWPAVLVAFPFVMVLGGPLGEEPGWRGFALPELAGRRPMLQASLILGSVWFAWHLPLLLARPGELVPGLVGILSASVVFAWLYQSSGGVVLLPLLMHTAQNTFGGEFAGPMFTGADATRLSWLRGGLYLLLAVVLAVRDARFRGSEPLPTPAATGSGALG
jgi:membrane protease YdiL (CAAX protease family)